MRTRLPLSRLIVPVLVLILLGAGVAMPMTTRVAARQATPTAQNISLPIAPDPSLCQVEPRPVEDFSALVGTPVPATPTVFEEQPGTPADQAVIDEVTATLVELAACQNAGDYLRIGAIYSNAGLAEDFTWVDEASLDFIAAPPEPGAPEDWQVINSISQVELLPDGRVGARVEFGEGGGYGPDYLIFVEENGRLLLDHWVDELLVKSDGTPDGMRLVSIGERSLAMECRGESSPTVILESGGIGTPSGVWGGVIPYIAEFTRVCRYERANNWSGLSDPAPMPRTGADVVADLHALLKASGEPGPYVLVGPSLGGLFVRLYAATYPDEVAGLVLVDATHEESNTSQALFLPPEEMEQTIEADTADGDPEGIWTPEQLPITFAQMREARDKGPMKPMPLVVLAAGKFDEDPNSPYPPAADAIWPPLAMVLQTDLSLLVPNARLIVAEESGHFIHLDQPDLVIDAIHDVVDAVRDPSTWEGAVATPVS